MQENPFHDHPFPRVVAMCACVGALIAMSSRHGSGHHPLNEWPILSIEEAVHKLHEATTPPSRYIIALQRSSRDSTGAIHLFSHLTNPHPEHMHFKVLHFSVHFCACAPKSFSKAFFNHMLLPTFHAGKYKRLGLISFLSFQSSIFS